MDSDVTVRGSLSSNGGGVGSLRADTPSFTSYTKLLDGLCPMYMSMGMSYEAYWHSADPDMYKAYHDAYKLTTDAEIDRINTHAWLAGYYVYHALIDVAPIYHAFAKADTTPEEYMKQPLPLTPEEAKKRKEQEEYEHMMQMREQFMASINRNKKKEGGHDERTT